MKLSNKVENLQESATLKMAGLANSLKEKGVSVINLSLGEPDFNTPEFIKDAAKIALDKNFTHYSPVPGFKDLKDAIVHKLKRDNNLEYSSDQIVVSTGAKQSIMNVILSIVNEGDEVVLPTPYWVSYKDMAEFAGAKVTEIFADISTDFKVSPKDLEKVLNKNSKLFIFSNPCNPSGTVYNPKELEELSKVFKKYPDLTIISDEIYEHINYLDKSVSLASFKSIKEQVVTVNGLSKGFAMTGWRLGYIAAPVELAKACSKIQGQFTSGANSIAQKAAVAALNADPVSTHLMKEEFFKRRNYLAKALSEISGFKVNNPDGAFYLFPDISYYFNKEILGVAVKDSLDFAMLLLDKAHVACTPGEPFGNPNNIRFSYAASIDDLKEAISRIKKVLT